MRDESLFIHDPQLRLDGVEMQSGLLDQPGREWTSRTDPSWMLLSTFRISISRSVGAGCMGSSQGRLTSQLN
jgi:hypothetical protein